MQPYRALTEAIITFYFRLYSKNTYRSNPFTGIGPEFFSFVGEGNKRNGAQIYDQAFYDKAGFNFALSQYVLRPEVIESAFYAYRITGDPKWQEFGWEAVSISGGVADSREQNLLNDFGSLLLVFSSRTFANTVKPSKELRKLMVSSKQNWARKLDIDGLLSSFHLLTPVGIAEVNNTETLQCKSFQL